MIKIQLLHLRYIETLRLSFLAAFADYKTSINLSKGVFNARLKQISCDLELSVAAFDKDEIVAFIISGIGQYNGKLTAYNGGTGVIPKFRGQQLSTKIYQNLIRELKAQNIEQCLLEVIQDNYPAIKVYANLGFKKTKEYKCFSLKKGVLPKKKGYYFPIGIKKVVAPNWGKYTAFWTTLPSWQNTVEAIDSTNSEATIILEAYSENILVGYIIANTSTKTISQLAIRQEYRRRGIASRLLKEAKKQLTTKKMAIININSDAVEMISFFESLGFQNHLNQFEMVLEL